MNTLIVLDNELDKASELLLKNEVVAFPTETVYGLGVVCDSYEAFKKLVSAKNRPSDKPFTLMCSDVKQIENVAVLNDKIKKIINHFMPGEITLLLKAKDDVNPWVDLNTKKIGVRIPNFPLALKLIKKVGKPLLVPSANPSGLPPALDFKQTYDYFNGAIAGIVNAKSGAQKPSTIIDLSSDEPILIREGNITLEDVMRIWRNE